MSKGYAAWSKEGVTTTGKISGGESMLSLLGYVPLGYPTLPGGQEACTVPLWPPEPPPCDARWLQGPCWTGQGFPALGTDQATQGPLGCPASCLFGFQPQLDFFYASSQGFVLRYVSGSPARGRLCSEASLLCQV